MVRRIRARWPKVRILVRADAAFAAPEVYDRCEGNCVDHLIGLVNNKVLERFSAPNHKAAKIAYHGWLAKNGASLGLSPNLPLALEPRLPKIIPKHGIAHPQPFA